MDAGLKWLSPHYPAIQITAMRAIASLPFVIVYVAIRGSAASLFKVRWSLHLLRGFLGIGMLALFTFGLKSLPLSEAYSLFFIAPMLITALSVPLLKEKVGVSRWIAVFIGLLGVIIVLRPSPQNLVSLGSLAVLIAAVCYSVSAIAVRVISRTDSSDSMVFWAKLAAHRAATFARTCWHRPYWLFWSSCYYCRIPARRSISDSSFRIQCIGYGHRLRLAALANSA